MPVLPNFKLIILIVILAGAIAFHIIDRKAAYAEGQVTEREAWQAQKIADEAIAEANRRKSQAAIDKIKADAQDQIDAARTSDLNHISDLEKALADETNAPSTDGHCPAALSRRVRDSLAAIGR
jgi:biopolymer transport protein ExbB/TolQ